MNMSAEVRQSGAVCLDTLKALRVAIGPEKYAEAEARLDPAYRAALESATALSWIPADAIEQLFDRAAEVSGRNRSALQDETTRRAIERTFGSIWRVLLRVTSDAAIVARTPMLWSKTFDRGSMSATIPEPGHGELVVVGWPEVSDFHLRGLQVATQTVLELAGRQNVTIRLSRTSSGAKYHARWGV